MQNALCEHSLMARCDSSTVAPPSGGQRVNEEQIAEKLAELEPAWAGRPNLFDKQIAARDVKSLPGVHDAEPSGRRAAAIDESLSQEFVKALLDGAKVVAAEALGIAGCKAAAAIATAQARATRSLGQLARTGNFDFVMKDQAVSALHRLLGDGNLRVQFAGFGDPAGNQRLAQHLTSN